MDENGGDPEFSKSLNLYSKNIINTFKQEEHMFFTRLSKLVIGNWFLVRIFFGLFFVLHNRLGMANPEFIFITFMTYYISNILAMLHLKTKFEEFVSQTDMFFVSVYNGSAAISSIGMVLLVSNTITPSTTKLFNIPLMIIGVVGLIYSIRSRLAFAVFFSFIYLLDAIQRLTLLFFNQENIDHDSIEWQFIFYKLYGFLQFLIYFCTLIFVLITEIQRFKRNIQMNNLNKLRLLLVTGALPTYICELYFSKRIYRFFISLFKGTLLKDEPGRLFSKEVCLEIGDCMFIAYFALVLIYSIAFKVKLKPLINKFSLEEISNLTVFKIDTPVTSTFYRVSDNLFRRINPPTNESSLCFEDECFMCLQRPSNIIIDPCGHGGFCSGCISFWVFQNQNCPICKSNFVQMEVINLKRNSRSPLILAYLAINENVF